jgi:hypothetical protein
MFDSINDRLPIFALYLVFVSILGGPLLFTNLPCNIRDILSKNLLFRHIFGFLFVYTGVVLTMKFNTNIIPKSINTKMNDRLILASILYFIFLCVTNIGEDLFIGIIFIMGLIYILYTKKEEYEEEIENTKVSQNDKLYLENKINTIVIINNSLTIISFIIVFVGFFIQLGSVKIQKGTSFDFIEFFFGDAICIRDNISYTKALQNVFS